MTMTQRPSERITEEVTSWPAGRGRSVLTMSELGYLRRGGARRLARIATFGSDGTPHVVPVGFRYEPAHDSIDVGEHELERTKKYRDVERAGRASAPEAAAQAG
jgi:Pyridoxamine 5'-phosphate oxidase